MELDPYLEVIGGGAFFHGYRFALLRIPDGKVNIHVDWLNGQEEGLEYCYTQAFLVELDGILYRLSIIGYPRASVLNHRRRTELYQPVITRLVKFYEGLPEDRKHVTPDLLHPNPDVSSDDDALQRPEHVDKMVYYGQIGEMVNIALRHYGIDTEQLKMEDPPLIVPALHYAHLMTNNPSYFFEFIKTVLAGPTGLPEEAWRVAWDAYCFYQKRKEDVKAKAKLSLPGQRFQPHFHLKKPPQPCFFKKHVEEVRDCLVLAATEPKPDKAYVQSCKLASLKVRGAGKFTSQHLICIACAAGHLPAKILDHVFIAEGTKTHERLLEIAPGMKEGKWEDHSEKLLSAVANVLGISRLAAENLICIFGREGNTGDGGARHARRSAVSDIYFPGLSLVCIGPDCKFFGIFRKTQGPVPLPTPSVDFSSLDLSSGLFPPSALKVAKPVPAVRYPVRKRECQFERLSIVSAPLLAYVAMNFKGCKELTISKNFLTAKRSATHDPKVTDLRICGRGFWNHNDVWKSSVRGLSGTRYYRPGNFSEAAPLYSKSPTYVDDYDRFFPDKREAIEYAIWSVLLNPRNRALFLEHIVPHIMSLPCIADDTALGFGRRIVQDNNASLITGTVYRLPSKAVEVTLYHRDAEGKYHRKGDTVSVQKL